MHPDERFSKQLALLLDRAHPFLLALRAVHKRFGFELECLLTETFGNAGGIYPWHGERWRELEDLVRNLEDTVPALYGEVASDESLELLFRGAIASGDLRSACLASRALGKLKAPECYPCDAHGKEDPHVRAAWALSPFEARLLCSRALTSAKREAEAQEGGSNV